MAERIPPYDQQAEVACIGAVLLNNRVLPELRAVLSGPDEFYLDRHRTLWRAVLELASRGAAIDHVTLGSYLADTGMLDRIGGPMALDSFTEAVATTANAAHYANIVRNHAAVRRMVAVAQGIAAQGYAGVDDVADFLAGARKDITVASAVGGTGGPSSIGDGLGEVFKELESGQMPEGLVRTGIDAIDELTGGLWPGLLHVVGARPSMGKSALCLNIVTNCALQKRPALYIPTEDARRYIQLRELARFADVDLNDLMLRTVQPGDWQKLTSAANTLVDLPLWVDDSPGLSSERIGQIAALHKQMHGLELLVVDHLGELTDKAESQTAVIEAAAKGLRDIAKELDIPVLLATQLNREVERRTDKRPTLHDLRQSGAVEQIARVVWFMYRRGYYEQGCEDDPDTQLIVAKATHGKTGTIRLWSDLSRMFIRGWDLDTDGPFPETGAGKYVRPHSTKDSKTGYNEPGFFKGTGQQSKTAERRGHWTDEY